VNSVALMWVNRSRRCGWTRSGPSLWNVSQARLARRGLGYGSPATGGV